MHSSVCAWMFSESGLTVSVALASLELTGNPLAAATQLALV